MMPARETLIAAASKAPTLRDVLRLIKQAMDAHNRDPQAHMASSGKHG